MIMFWKKKRNRYRIYYLNNIVRIDVDAYGYQTWASQGIVEYYDEKGCYGRINIVSTISMVYLNVDDLSMLVGCGVSDYIKKTHNGHIVTVSDVKGNDYIVPQCLMNAIDSKGDLSDRERFALDLVTNIPITDRVNANLSGEQLHNPKKTINEIEFNQFTSWRKLG